MQGGGELPWDVTCRGVVDGIALVIHMTRREGRRFVEEAAVVHGYDAGTTTWDIHAPETDRRLQIYWAGWESRRISRDWIGFPDDWG